MSARLVRLIEVDEVAALERDDGAQPVGSVCKGQVLMPPRPAPRGQADPSPAWPQRLPGQKDALSALRIGAYAASSAWVSAELETDCRRTDCRLVAGPKERVSRNRAGPWVGSRATQAVRLQYCERCLQ